jgi:spore germination cell wall hydrolase CwlJ-like protein
MIQELIKLSECAAVAMTILGEAEGEPWAGKMMVTETFVNRATESGNSLKYECLKSGQYSCWNGEERQRKLINRAAELERINSQAWKDCKELAKSVCQPGYKTTTRATHYYAPARLKTPPKWANKMKLVAVVAGHKFFCEVKNQKEIKG